MLIPFVALLLVNSSPRPDYVPDEGWKDDEWAQTFHERWFGDQLKAMREPVLATESDLAGFRERFRLLLLPSNDHSYSYRVDVRQDGSARLSWARLSGKGGYAPGGLARHGSRKLSEAEVARFLAALEVASLQSLPRDENNLSEEGEAISICVDGTQLVFEHLAAATRSFITRNCDTEEALERLAGVLSEFKPRETMD